ncbi:Histone acetyltransferase HAC2 [Cardamine amara subsp. amara]|uniref:histone acetyltransferase n=1 Tax=Cardamine amara subsp. amara TaxID=228776 RepID=A0ABD1ALG6_CARAN
MPLPKRSRDLMTELVDLDPDEPEERDQLKLNVMSGTESQRLRPIRSNSNANYQTGTPRQPNVKSDEEFHGGRNQPEDDYFVPKRPRYEAPIRLNTRHQPWFRLPGIQLYPNSSTLPANAIAQHQSNVSTTQRSPEEVSSYPMLVSSNCFVDEATERISGRSDLTKLDDMPAQGLRTSSKPIPTMVDSFDDLISERKIQTEDIVDPMICDEGAKCEVNVNRKKRNVSVVERFTDEEIKLHLMSLKSGIRKVSDLKEEDICQLCDGGKLIFPPPPIYCAYCNNRVKDYSCYYIPEEEVGDVQIQVCNGCYHRCKRTFTLFGINIVRDHMLKFNNLDNQVVEEWVECGYCKGWQHQICGLYNKHKDTDDTAEYVCPKCLLKERERNKKSGFDDNTDLGAKDFPETILSYFIEQRLFKRLEEERKQTAEATGKSINEVLEPEDLTLRVVYSADKTSIVNKKFSDLLHKENYPSEFPYRSKAILLFQKVEGVDICIFAMFVQEFGSECSLPNQRTTYIVYLDSVKYFRPERVTFSGEALRTFVYHEILIGYLEYCKLRGFTTSYIWACAPSKGDDYILYNHPVNQKTPNTKKLRQWYVSLLDKAVKQDVVVNVTNLHEQFFAGKDEYTLTASRLPYFEGSFWSSRAELLIYDIESQGNNELPKMVRSLSRKILKGLSYDSSGCVDIDDAKNILLMRKLEKKVSQNKEYLMVVQLNYSCTRCSKPILSGFRWFCQKCKNLQFCESCYVVEQELDGEHIHELSKVLVKGISSTTEDNDLILENELFENRQAFLAFSQKHNYSFDILRHAKYSSMMILHHLHTSNKTHCPQITSSCRHLACGDCGKDVSRMVYFPCLLCSSFRLCTGCYTRKRTFQIHLHLFPTLPSVTGVQPKTVMVLEILNALKHVHECKSAVSMSSSSCSHTKCNEVKLLFYHSSRCRKEKGDNCSICRRLWKVIRIHANHCDDLVCPIHRCR